MGMKVEELCWEYGINTPTVYTWKSKFAGMDVSEAPILLAVEDENRRLKQLAADQSPHQEVLKEVIRKIG